MRRLGLIFCGLLALRLVLMALVPVFEPSEARYAAISANMARTGDFVIPHFTHKLEYQSFDGKPPLVFQAGGVFCRLFGTERPQSLQFAVRLFPLLSALLLLVILYRTVRNRSGEDAARLAVAICTTCVAFYAAAGIAMTDMSLACCVSGALLLYGDFAVTNRWRDALGIAALLGAGMIVKGPVALVLFGLPVLTDAIVNRRWRGIFNARWLAVAPVFLLVAVPWFVLAEQRNPGAVKYFFYNENFLRFVSHDYGDKYGAGREAFRGVSVLWALVVTLPWALVPLWRGLRNWRGWRTLGKWDGWRAFDVLSVLAIVGFWCLTSRVLLYYLFPVIAPFAAALATRGNRTELWRMVPWAAALAGVVLTVTLVGGACFSDKMRGAAAEFNPWTENYAHEFYHGTRPAAELERYREVRDNWVRSVKERMAK